MANRKMEDWNDLYPEYFESTCRETLEPQCRALGFAWADGSSPGSVAFGLKGRRMELSPFCDLGPPYELLASVQCDARSSLGSTPPIHVPMAFLLPRSHPYRSERGCWKFNDEGELALALNGFFGEFVVPIARRLLMDPASLHEVAQRFRDVQSEASAREESLREQGELRRAADALWAKGELAGLAALLAGSEARLDPVLRKRLSIARRKSGLDR